MRGTDTSKVQGLAGPLAASLGLEILKIELVSEHGDAILRIYLDKPGAAVTIDDCENFSRNLGPILDVEGELPSRYHLEVSSPGLNRPLASLEHFRAQLGKIVDLKTEEPINGRRHFKGRLQAVEAEEGGWLRVESDGVEFKIPFAGIKKAHLDYFASEALEQGPILKGRKKTK